MLKIFRSLLPVSALTLLASCGGGGDSNTASSAVTGGAAVPSITCALPQQLNDTGDACVIKAKLYDTSYANLKSYPTDSIKYPSYTNYIGIDSGWASPPKDEAVVAVGYGEFINQGELSMFVAFANHEPQRNTLAQVNGDSRYLSDFTFWKINKDLTATKTFTTKGCLFPRVALVADFNKDGIPDVWVACPGYDSHPFPGEKSKLMLSKGRGNYQVMDVGDIGFNHGASAGDVNGDGYPDVITSDMYFYINQKDGTFKKDTTLIKNLNFGPNNNPGYGTVDLVDINGDGVLDIIAGGAEYLKEGADTKIWYGDKDGTFGRLTTIIPPVQGKGQVNDFTIINADGKRYVYVNRTGDETINGQWYHGSVIQRYEIATNTSVVSDFLTYPVWVPWTIPKTQNGQLGVGPYDRVGFFK
jgi:FG-GAP-like repeat